MVYKIFNLIGVLNMALTQIKKIFADYPYLAIQWLIVIEAQEKIEPSVSLDKLKKQLIGYIKKSYRMEALNYFLKNFDSNELSKKVSAYIDFIRKVSDGEILYAPRLAPQEQAAEIAEQLIVIIMHEPVDKSLMLSLREVISHGFQSSYHFKNFGLLEKKSNSLTVQQVLDHLIAHQYLSDKERCWLLSNHKARELRMPAGIR
jgi:hypothetical protein